VARHWEAIRRSLGGPQRHVLRLTQLGNRGRPGEPIVAAATARAAVTVARHGSGPQRAILRNDHTLVWSMLFPSTRSCASAKTAAARVRHHLCETVPMPRPSGARHVVHVAEVEFRQPVFARGPHQLLLKKKALPAATVVGRSKCPKIWSMLTVVGA